jgi:hypothetical protein
MKENLLIVNTLLNHKNSGQLLKEHHLEGIFYHQFPIDNQYLKEQYKKQWIHNSVLISELETLSSHLQNQNIKGCLLKGAHLLMDLYPDHGSRFLSDVDILTTDTKGWEQLLQTQGYTPINETTFLGNNFKKEWIKKIELVEVNIELHTKLFFHLKNEKWVFQNSKLAQFQTLSPEDTFIHLCGHLAFQHTFLKLYWLFDIYFYVKKHESVLNWDEIKFKSQNLNLYQSVVMCLWCLNKYFTLPAHLVEKFKLNEVRWWQKYLTLDFLLSPDEKKIDYFLIKHATKDHLFEAIWYDLTWVWHYKVQTLLLK